jgi:hypothetical protein
MPVAQKKAAVIIMLLLIRLFLFFLVNMKNPPERDISQMTNTGWVTLIVIFK